MLEMFLPASEVEVKEIATKSPNKSMDESVLSLSCSLLTITKIHKAMYGDKYLVTY